ncbi:MAG: hypothetical protein FWD53_08185 [Phycisphaerales bacterium]|nr:hypothetical protein [Phycisphaerales bacterium]
MSVKTLEDLQQVVTKLETNWAKLKANPPKPAPVNVDDLYDRVDAVAEQIAAMTPNDPPSIGDVPPEGQETQKDPEEQAAQEEAADTTTTQ